MRSKPLLLLLSIAFLFSACGSNDRRFSIIGDIANMPEQSVVLEQLNANDIIAIVDSARSGSNGHFELSGVAPEPGMYRLHFRQNKFILLSIDKGNIKVNSDWNTFDHYTVGGSAPSEQMKRFIGVINQNMTDYFSLSVVIDTLRARGSDSLLGQAQKQLQDVQLRVSQYLEKYADTTPYEPNAIFAARMLNAATESPFLTTFSQNLTRRFPNTRMTEDFAEYYVNITSRQKQTKQAPAPSFVDAGAAAPDITLQDAGGHNVSLSSYKGKYVLLDFWASWCSPCRHENPGVVAAWQKYKDKNFTVLSVSLDNKRDAWQKAVKDDGLAWTQVSDLKGWESPAALTYNIQSIPSNFLIDPKGKIIARNLRGEQLEVTLAQVLK